MTPLEALEETIALHSTSQVGLMGIGDLDWIQDLRRSYERTVVDIDTEMAQSRNGAILEIGSYLGVVSRALKKLGYDVTAQDLREFQELPALQQIYREADIRFVGADLRENYLPYPSDSFDAVVMCEVLEHLNFNPVPILREIHRVVRDGGIFYLSLPNLARLRSRLRLILGRSIHPSIDHFFWELDPSKQMVGSIHWREYTPVEIRELLERTGFTVTRQYLFAIIRERQSTLLNIAKKTLFTLVPGVKDNQTAIAIKGERRPRTRCRFADGL